jgi:hypothetical protein
VCRWRIRRELGTWKGSREFYLELCEDTLVFSSDRAKASIPVHQINLCEELGEWYLIAWKNFPAVTIPKTVAETTAAPLLQKIQALYQG